MKKLGTILPTKESINLGNAHYMEQRERRMLIAKEQGLASMSTVKHIHGETQYWVDDNTYAIVGRDERLKWFERRDDGDYRLKKP